MNRQELLTYARFLNCCNTHDSVRQGRQLHLLFLKKGVLLSTISIANRLLQMYSRCGRTDDARHLFDEMPYRNSFSWNTLLEGFANEEHKTGLLQVFFSMPQKNEFSWNVVISGLAKVGDLDVMQRFFDEMPRKNGIVWNTVIHGYARNGRPSMAIQLFKDFLKWEAVEIRDPFVLSTSVRVCAQLGGLAWGKQIHARVIVDHMEFDSVLESSFVNLYAKCGDLDSVNRLLNGMRNPNDYSLSSLITGYASCCRMNDARRIFELKSDPCVVLWNSLISGYVFNESPSEALALFSTMHNQGVLGDSSTLSNILNACGSLGVLKNAIQLHAHTLKLGTLCDLIVVSALVDAYAKCESHNDACNLFGELKCHDTVLLNSMITIYCDCGRIEEAARIFENMKAKSLISWNSMIVGFSRNGHPVEALDLFFAMNKIGLSFDRYSLASVISACASIPSLELGEQVFARTTVVGVDFDQVIATSLVDLYCKCGFVNLGRIIFDQMTKCDVVSWNSMLMGYATNGRGNEAMALFNEMRSESISPSQVTFTAVLSACDHCGLVEEGKKWFRRMNHEYHLNPGIEHYSCMLDLFVRAGCLKEAMDLIHEMPFQADASMCSAILRGCITNGDKFLSKKIADRVIELDPQNSGALVQLSGMLASGGDWERSALVRQMIKDTRIQKFPGQSWCSI